MQPRSWVGRGTHCELCCCVFQHRLCSCGATMRSAASRCRHLADGLGSTVAAGPATLLLPAAHRCHTAPDRRHLTDGLGSLGNPPPHPV